MTDDLILETGDELTGTECEVMIFCFAAFKCDAVDITVKINVRDIVFLCRTVGDLDGTSVTTADAIKFLVDVLLQDALHFPLAFDTEIAIDLTLRFYIDGCLEGRTVFDRDDADLGLTNDIECSLFDGCLIGGR